MIHSVASQPKQTVNNGGPAFPRVYEFGDPKERDYVNEGGMTLWHYFAAHAPAEIPNWAEHYTRLDKLPPEKPPGEFCDDCKADTGECTTPDVCEALYNHNRKCSGIRKHNEASRYVQWRFIYADLMIAEMERRAELAAK